MITAQEVVTQAFAGGEVPDVPVIHVDDRATAALIGTSAVVDRLHFPGRTGNDPPLRQIRLKESGENDTAGVLPFLKGRLGLGLGPLGDPRDHCEGQTGNQSK